jgi:AcrR family transcriptional regulator
VSNSNHVAGEPYVPRRSDFVRRRRLVLDAFLDLVLEGDPSPAPAAVAERAGVSRASVFRYFATLEELRIEAMGRVFERFLDLFELDEDPSASGIDRIALFVESRMRFHETLHPLALLQRRHAADSDDAAALIDMSRNLLADQVRSYFRRELEHLSDDERDDVVVNIAVVTSVESWHQSHHSHGRSPARIRRAWISAIAALLAGTPSTQNGDRS